MLISINLQIIYLHMKFEQNKLQMHLQPYTKISCKELQAFKDQRVELYINQNKGKNKMKNSRHTEVLPNLFQEFPK